MNRPTWHYVVAALYSVITLYIRMNEWRKLPIDPRHINIIWVQLTHEPHKCGLFLHVSHVPWSVPLVFENTYFTFFFKFLCIVNNTIIFFVSCNQHFGGNFKS